MIQSDGQLKLYFRMLNIYLNTDVLKH